MRVVCAAVMLMLAFPGCKNTEDGGKSQAPASASQPERSGPEEPASEESAETAPDADPSGIEWMHDDYPRALAQARAEKKALVIDMWANWCHTCLAMQEGALRDPGLAEVADDFVWLAVNTEEPSAAPVMAQFPPKVWPTFLVVSSEDESVQATQLGSATVSEFRAFLERGGSGHLATLEAKGQLDSTSPLFHLRAGDQAALVNELDTAAEAYGKALQLGGETWSHRAPTVKARLAALVEGAEPRRCAEFARSEMEYMSARPTPSSTDFIYYARACAALQSPPKATRLRQLALDGLKRLLADADPKLSLDDRSDALANARHLAEELKRPELALQYAHKQQDLLARAIAESDSALEELTYAWHQVELHAFLQEGDKVLPWLDELQKKLPEEYDPPFRKAWLLFQMDRFAEAHLALDQAMPLARGGRKGRMLAMRAEIFEAQGKTEKAREQRRAQVAFYRSLPAGQRRQKDIEEAEHALAKLDER